MSFSFVKIVMLPPSMAPMGGRSLSGPPRTGWGFRQSWPWPPCQPKRRRRGQRRRTQSPKISIYLNNLPLVVVHYHWYELAMCKGVPTLKAHLHCVTQPYDIRHMTLWSLFNNGLGPLKTKSPPITSPTLPLPKIPPPDFVLRGPNPLLKVIKLSCVWHHMVSSSSVNEPLVYNRYFSGWCSLCPLPVLTWCTGPTISPRATTQSASNYKFQAKVIIKKKKESTVKNWEIVKEVSKLSSRYSSFHTYTDKVRFFETIITVCEIVTLNMKTWWNVEMTIL